VVLSEGMPHYKNIDINGRLIIEFKVQYMVQCTQKAYLYVTTVLSSGGSRGVSVVLCNFNRTPLLESTFTLLGNSTWLSSLFSVVIINNNKIKPTEHL